VGSAIRFIEGTLAVAGHEDERNVALGQRGDGDSLRTLAEVVLPLPMEADVEGLIGAGHCERNGERVTWRKVPVIARFICDCLAAAARIARLWQGSNLPPFLNTDGLGEGADR
jgi:hypothetical protein